MGVIHELVRKNRDNPLVEEGISCWTNEFQALEDGQVLAMWKGAVTEFGAARRDLHEMVAFSPERLGELTEEQSEDLLTTLNQNLYMALAAERIAQARQLTSFAGRPV